MSKRYVQRPVRPTAALAMASPGFNASAPVPAYRNILASIPGSARSISVMGAVGLGVILLAYGITLLPKATFVDFDINGFRAEKADGQLRNMRSIIAESMGADALTMSGVAGWLEYEGNSGTLVMSIRNRDGEPVEGAYVQATFTRDDGTRGPKMLLHPDSTRRYSADVRSLETGPWGVAIVAIDPSVNYGSQLLFRVEKDIQIR